MMPPTNICYQLPGTCGQPYFYVYNAQGQMVRSTNPLGGVSQISYGALGAVTAVTDANNHATQYGHDANGNQTSTLFADGALETNASNPIGELLHSTDG